MTVVPFNPLDKRHLGESVGQAMLKQPIRQLTELEKFEGAGIYAIYYTGSFPAYSALSLHNQGDDFTAPIYVGKAVPKGSRKGGDLAVGAAGTVLYKRLSEHASSISDANNLDIADFHCRYLIVDDIWIPLGESLLIAKYSPLWNKLVDGFGNHNPGAGRHNGKRPRWDVLHPGRDWAAKCAERAETAEQIVTEVEDYMRSNPPSNDNSLISA